MSDKDRKLRSPFPVVGVTLYVLSNPDEPSVYGCPDELTLKLKLFMKQTGSAMARET